MVLPRGAEVRGTSVSVYKNSMSFPSTAGGGEESDGGKTGEENLLGTGFCSVENCQLGFLLEEPSVSIEFSLK